MKDDNQELADIAAELKEAKETIDFVKTPELAALMTAAFDGTLAQVRATADAIGCRAEFERHYAAAPITH